SPIRNRDPAAHALEKSLFERIELLVIRMFLFEQSFSLAQFTSKKPAQSSNGEKTAYVKYARHHVRPRRAHAAAAGPTQKRYIAQTGKPCGKERTSIKQQNGPVHHREIVEKGERAGEITGEPDNTGNQDNIEIDLQMREETKIRDMRHDESCSNVDGIGNDERARKWRK